MRIRRDPNHVLLEGDKIIWASGEIGQCVNCKKAIAYNLHGPEMMVGKLIVNLGQIDLLLGASPMSCVVCKDLVDRAVNYVESGKLKAVVKDGKAVVVLDERVE